MINLGKEHNHFESLFKKYSLSPQQIAVVTGILLDALIVQAVLVDNDQRVEIILEGDLSNNGKLNPVVKDIYNMRFGEVFGNFSTNQRS
ncbi:hypothetical protein KHT88_20070 [Alkalihalobacillus clausii]|uniref:hypothetical protein n=1 Tax=Shouchella TaxID=2893057 RepID=UPI00114E43DD|nr:hypothetical protein [Shouchella clausii]MBU3266142.1 hypothetical protein [Shouchella clausii]MBU3509052.1 hypothetical protein [Shouchella clausii]MBU3533204.1 hypothetical protein [Shouchella clausii]MBX0306141.1 hypothetical protein [Shouchella clausii]